MKTVLSGAGLALTAGLLMGAAMRPDLAGDDRPAGPQIIAAHAGVRSTGPFDGGGLGFASYGGKIPDYVVGSDWSRPPARAVAPPRRGRGAERAEVDYYESPIRDDPPEPALKARDLTPAAYADAAPDHAAADGDQAQAPALADPDRDAPPEATGDTRRSH